MASIKILPEELINKIAAGEVVERPASVVKELLDNAFDAKATHVTVEIEDGGRAKIVVIDDGMGMDKEDALMAFKAHATSKLSSEEDLFKITKFGFRGEALSSISAVSKCTLKTRTNSQNTGILVRVEGGNIVENTETGTPMGTSITIEDLFFNVPARKEFLKQAQSEYRAILDIIDAHAMASPQIGLTFINDGKTVYSFPKDDELEDRVRAIVGKDNYQQYMGLFYEHPHIEIFGFAGKPEIASDRPKNQFLFVNKRKVNDKAIHAVIKNTYSTLLPKNLQPQYVIMIQVQPNIVDVNVHPRKEEVKFSNINLITEGVSEAIKKAIERSNLTPGAKNDEAASDSNNPFASKSPMGGAPNPFGRNFGAPKSPFGAPMGNNNPFARPGPGGAMPSPFGNMPPRNPFTPAGGTNANSNANPGQNNFPGTLKSPFGNPYNSPFKKPNDGKLDDPTGKKPFGLFDDVDDEWNDDDDNFGSDKLSDKSMPGITSAQKSFYVVKNLYIVKEGPNGMVIYDQHAVHERINYEKLLEVYETGRNSGNTQKLLTPIVIELSAKDYSLLQENLEELNKSGFEIENFGNNSIKVTEVPALFADMDIKKLVSEFIADLEEDNKIKEVDSASHKALTYLSCRSAYKANDKISDQEIEVLLQKLETTDIKYTCPHGRPVKIELTFDELEKMFKRTGF
jgi:DNA mismatch repair protein MutL